MKKPKKKTKSVRDRLAALPQGPMPLYKAAIVLGKSERSLLPLLSDSSLTAGIQWPNMTDWLPLTPRYWHSLTTSTFKLRNPKNGRWKVRFQIPGWAIDHAKLNHAIRSTKGAPPPVSDAELRKLVGEVVAASDNELTQKVFVQRENLERYANDKGLLTVAEVGKSPLAEQEIYWEYILSVLAAQLRKGATLDKKPLQQGAFLNEVLKLSGQSKSGRHASWIKVRIARLYRVFGWNRKKN